MFEEREMSGRLPEKLLTIRSLSGEQTTVPDFALSPERIFLGYGVKNHDALYEVAKLLPPDPGILLIDPCDYHLTVLNIEKPHALLRSALKANPDINLEEFVHRLLELSKTEVIRSDKEIPALGNRIAVYGDAPNLYLALELMFTPDIVNLHRPFQIGLKHLLEDFKIEHIKEVDPRIGRQLNWRPHISFAKVSNELPIINLSQIVPLFLSPFWKSVQPAAQSSPTNGTVWA